MTENRIDRTLKTLKQEGKKALIPFVTAGHGGYDLTEQLVLRMEAAGANLIELGVPFSDPIAEGPVIQHASEQSLRQGTTLTGIFELVKRLRKQTDMPLLLMMYLNTIFSHGTEEFFRTCKEVGIDGVIVPDMPFEEKDEIQSDADKYGIHNISLVTPASEGRTQMIAEDATGFLYCVSSNGVTGMRVEIPDGFLLFLCPDPQVCKNPSMVGFGISNPKAAKQMSEYCDGVIIGSAIVNLVEQYQAQAPEKVYEFLHDIRTVLDA